MEYQPIAAYGLIGNLETCPLVSRDGSIDWCCFPHLESSSAFAALLDAEKGGRFAISPSSDFESEQEYVYRTNVLQTTFETDGGVATLTDFMPVVSETSLPPTVLRRVECLEGTVEIDVTFAPRFDYARAETTVETTADGARATGNGERLFLTGPTDFRIEKTDTGETARASCSLSTGESAWFVLQYGAHEPLDADDCAALLTDTIDYWHEWEHRCTHPTQCPFDGPWHELVVRSELVFKLLTHHETDAIAAAPTTSLPEHIGGVRNWDYRFTWIRDAGLTVRALYRLGHTEEATGYLKWCLRLSRADDPGELRQPLYRPLYGLHGDIELEERELDHLSGYEHSTPVRIGNDARAQRQHDIYGELVLAVYETSRHGRDISAESWNAIRAVVDHVCEVWEEPDMGIWEVRSEPQQFVHSKVMCWVALDRGIEMAENTGHEADTETWAEHRDAIKREVLERGFDPEIGSFTQSYESDALDASVLRIPAVGFLSPDDDRVLGTIDAVTARLATEDGLVYRYDGEDGVGGPDNPFILCSFWLVDALAMAGRHAEARERFEGVLDYASPLGLLAEEIDPETGALLGNFPQAFSHLGLVDSALLLSESEEGVAFEPATETVEGQTD